MNGFDGTQLMNALSISTLVMSFKRMGLGVSIALLSGLVLMQPARAEHPQCQPLRGQLAALTNQLHASSASFRRSPDARRLIRLEKKQKRTLRALRIDARSLKCHRRAEGDRGFRRQCRSLLRKIDKFERALEKTAARKERLIGRQRTTDPVEIRDRRRRVIARMESLSCVPAPGTEIAAREPQRKRSFLERLFGSRPDRSSRYSSRYDEAFGYGADDGSVYRTLCVRTCDGYYFPISFATVRSSFDTDQAICTAANLNTEMQLFVHLNPGESSEDMVDLAGLPYINLPNAFRYRQEFVSNDVCPAAPPPDLTQVAAGQLDQDVLLQPALDLSTNPRDVTQAAVIPIPRAKADIFNDPDTYAAKIGDFVLSPVNQVRKRILAAEGPTGDYDPNRVSELGVRVVGPTFLADQEAVKLLQAPDRVATPSTPGEGA